MDISTDKKSHVYTGSIPHYVIHDDDNDDDDDSYNMTICSSTEFDKKNKDSLHVDNGCHKISGSVLSYTLNSNYIPSQQRQQQGNITNNNNKIKKEKKKRRRQNKNNASKHTSSSLSLQPLKTKKKYNENNNAAINISSDAMRLLESYTVSSSTSSLKSGNKLSLLNNKVNNDNNPPPPPPSLTITMNMKRDINNLKDNSNRITPISSSSPSFVTQNINDRIKRWEKQIELEPLPDSLGTKEAEVMLEKMRVYDHPMLHDKTSQKAQDIEKVIKNRFSNRPKKRQKKTASVTTTKGLSSSSPPSNKIKRTKSLFMPKTSYSNINKPSKSMNNSTRENKKKEERESIKIIDDITQSRFYNDNTDNINIFTHNKAPYSNDNNTTITRAKVYANFTHNDNLQHIDNEAEGSNIRIMDPMELSDRQDVVQRANEHKLQQLALVRLNSINANKKTSIDELSSSYKIRKSDDDDDDDDDRMDEEGGERNKMSKQKLMKKAAEAIKVKCNTNMHINSLVQKWGLLHDEIHNEMNYNDKGHKQHVVVSSWSSSIAETATSIHESHNDNNINQPSPQSDTTVDNRGISADILEKYKSILPNILDSPRNYIRNYCREAVPILNERSCLLGNECESIKKYYIAIKQKNISTTIWNTATYKLTSEGPQYYPPAQFSRIPQSAQHQNSQPFPLREYLLPEMETKILEAQLLDEYTDGNNVEMVLSQIPRQPCILCNRLLTGIFSARIACGMDDADNCIVQNHGNIFGIDGEYDERVRFTAGEKHHGLIKPFVRYDRNDYIPSVCEIECGVIKHNVHTINGNQIYNTSSDKQIQKIKVKAWEEIEGMVYRQSTSHKLPLSGKYVNKTPYVNFPNLQNSLWKWYATTDTKISSSSSSPSTAENEKEKKEKYHYMQLLMSDNFYDTVSNFDKLVETLYGWTKSTIITSDDYDKYFPLWSIDRRSLCPSNCKFYVSLLLKINLILKYKNVEKDIEGEGSKCQIYIKNNNNDGYNNSTNDDEEDENVNYEETLKMFITGDIDDDDNLENNSDTDEVLNGGGNGGSKTRKEKTKRKNTKSNSNNNNNNNTSSPPPTSKSTAKINTNTKHSRFKTPSKPNTNSSSSPSNMRSCSERRYRLAKLDHFINKHYNACKWFYKHRNDNKLFYVTIKEDIIDLSVSYYHDHIPESLFESLPRSIPLRRCNADIDDLEINYSVSEWIEKPSKTVLQLSSDKVLIDYMLKEKIKQCMSPSSLSSPIIKKELSNIMNNDKNSPHNLYLKPFIKVIKIFLLDPTKVDKNDKKTIEQMNEINDFFVNHIFNNNHNDKYTLLDLLNLSSLSSQNKILNSSGDGGLYPMFNTKHSIMLALLYCIIHCEKRMYWIDTTRQTKYNGNGDCHENEETEEEEEEEEEDIIMEEVFSKPGTTSNSSIFPKFNEKNKLKYFLMEKYNFALHTHRMSFLSLFRWIVKERAKGNSASDDQIPFILLYPLDDGSFTLNTMTEYSLPDLTSVILQIRFWSETNDKNLAIVRAFEKSLPYRSHCRSIAQMLCETCRQDDMFYLLIKRLLFLSLTGGYQRRWPTTSVGIYNNTDYQYQQNRPPNTTNSSSNGGGRRRQNKTNNKWKKEEQHDKERERKEEDNNENGYTRELREDRRYWTQTQRPHFRSIYFISDQLIDKSKRFVLSFLYQQGFFTKSLLLENLLSNIYDLPHLRETQIFINWPAFEREADFAVNAYRVHLDLCSSKSYQNFSIQPQQQQHSFLNKEEKKKEEEEEEINSANVIINHCIINSWKYEKKLEQIKKMGSIYPFIKECFVLSILNQMNTLQEDLIVMEMTLREYLYDLYRAKELSIKFFNSSPELSSFIPSSSNSIETLPSITLNANENFIRGKIEEIILETMVIESDDIIDKLNNTNKEEEEGEERMKNRLQLIHPLNIDKYIILKEKTLHEFKINHSITPDVKTMIWHFVMGMIIDNDNEEKNVNNQQNKSSSDENEFGNEYIDDDDDDDDNVDGVSSNELNRRKFKEILGDDGLRIYAKLLGLYADKVSHKALNKTLNELTSKTFSRLYFMLRCYEFALSIQLTKLNAPMVKKIENAMINHRYKLMKNEPLPSCAYHVYITLCCNRIATHVDPNCYGHKAIVFDSIKQAYICGKKQSKKAFKDDLSLAIASSTLTKNQQSQQQQQQQKGGGGGKLKRTRSGRNKSINTVSPSPTVTLPSTAGVIKGKENQQQQQQSDPRITASYFTLKNRSIKVKRKMARREKREREYLKCHETPVLTLFMKNYRLSYGNGDKHKKSYQFCPGCGNFHRYNELLDSGIGGYMCYDCSRNIVEKMNIYKCEYCHAELTEDQVRESYACPLVDLTDSENSIQIHFYCGNHQIKNGYKKPLIFLDRHQYLLTRRNKITGDLFRSRTSDERKMITKQNKKRASVWNYKR